MNIKFLNLITTLTILFLFQVGPVYSGDKTTENSDEFNSLFSKLIKWDPISCPGNSNCFCIDFKAKVNIPLRYKYSQWCSADSDNNRPLKGIWEVTNFDTQWNKVEEGLYLNGLMHGTWVTFGENGNITEQRTYKNGEVVNNSSN